ncbi:MAG: helix-turn-helix domain-containing protein [Streptosporangiales bacterium]|nr:helix-turn-helix domain-containing protein [Streptosporangiales bacterium]
MSAELPGGPTVRRILLGAQLRRLREAAGITRETAGYHIRGSDSKISRMELGRVGFKERDVADLLTLYGVTAEEDRTTILGLVSEANSPGWWHRYNDILPPWFETYVGMEEAASRIRTYEVQFVPGLLQTEDYARAVMGPERLGISEDEIEKRVAVRMSRQRRLNQPDPLLLWAVVDEAVLHRRIGGPDVMCAQLKHLIEVAELPNVTLQVLPFSYGGHAAEGGAFSLLRYSEPDLPDIVYVEQLTGALYLDKREDVDSYVETMEHLAVQAATPEKSLELLRDIAEDT